MTEQQHFIHHPEEFSIELQSKENTPLPTEQPLNLKLVCNSTIPFSSGESIGINLPEVSNEVEVLGIVDWCTTTNSGYELGIQFSDSDALMRIRMLEQLCFIKRYRTYVLNKEGRDISDQDAALEWIAKYANLFPTAG
ncbi:MAG: hypothetical protein ACRBB6_15430 [Neptuniibacter sp.]